MPKEILVVGASGRNGRAVLRHLIGQGRNARAAARNPEKIDEPGATPVRFDLREPETYGAALDGVERLFLIVPEDMPDGPPLARQLLERAVGAGVRRVVALSAMGVDKFPGHPLQMVEQAVTDLAPSWGLLRPNWFMHNFSDGLFRRGIVEHDVIAAPAGDATVSFIDVEDIAAAGTAVLLSDGESAAYELTGPEALSFAEVARVISAAAGRTIRYEPLDIQDPELPAKLGLPAAHAMQIQALFGRVLAGLEAPVTGTVAELTGRPPNSFDSFARREEHAWKSAA